MWVAGEHRTKLLTFMVQRAKAVTENNNAPCVARKEAPISIDDAHALLSICGIVRFTVMQYGQKADFNNKVVQWALKNVRKSVCVCVCVCVCVFVKWVPTTNGCFFVGCAQNLAKD
jgi:hypothetical protein